MLVLYDYQSSLGSIKNMFIISGAQDKENNFDFTWDVVLLLTALAFGMKLCYIFLLGIPGDGSCLFRAVVHSSCITRGKPAPSDSLQKELADELRDKVVNELIKRRNDAEWYLEGEFDRYIRRMRQYHVWGGEPELLMASHVLKMPITVYMYDKKSCNFNIIAEYGQTYGWKNPIRILYHGYGHYDALKSYF